MKSNRLISFFFGWLWKANLKTESATALKLVKENEDEVEEARRVLAETARRALENSQQVLTDLQDAQSRAAELERTAETARQEKVTDYNTKTADEVKALETRLANLKKNRAEGLGTLEGQLNGERQEAADQDRVATETEEAIALRIEALREESDAQDGLNDGKDGNVGA